MSLIRLKGLLGYKGTTKQELAGHTETRIKVYSENWNYQNYLGHRIQENLEMISKVFRMQRWNNRCKQTKTHNLATGGVWSWGIYAELDCRWVRAGAWSEQRKSPCGWQDDDCSRDVNHQFHRDKTLYRLLGRWHNICKYKIWDLRLISFDIMCLYIHVTSKKAIFICFDNYLAELFKWHLNEKWLSGNWNSCVA